MWIITFFDSEYKNCVGLWILFIKWRKLWGTVWRISCFLNGVHIIFPQMSAIMWMQSKCQRINNTQNAHTQKTSEEFSTLRKFFRISLSRGIQQGSFLTFFLDQRHRNGQLVQLLLVHHIGTLGHRLTGVLHLGERNHIPDRIRAGHQHH